MDSRSWRKLVHVGDRVNGGARSPDSSPPSVYPSEVQGTREFSALSRGSPRYTGQENGAFSTTSQAGALQTLWKKEGKRKIHERDILTSTNNKIEPIETEENLLDIWV